MKRAMRLSFELDRADNPPLYDELMCFPKGTRRVNRLRTLAHEGLIAQQARRGDEAAAPNRQASRPTQPKPKRDEAIEASLELFGPAI